VRAWSRPLLDLYPPMGPRVLRRLPEGWDDRPYERFTLAPMGPLIGAEVSGIDLRAPLADDVFAELDRALVEWKVLVLRDQHLTVAQQEALAARWGPLWDAALLPAGTAPARPGRVGGWQNYWHADDTFRAVPGMGTVLRITDAPLGGDTLFADMAAAYDNLDTEVQRTIDDLRAVHDCGDYAGVMYPDRVDEARRGVPPVEHPVVRRHPVTGRPTIFVNAAWTRGIVGLDPAEGDRLLLLLTAQATVPEYQCRVRWRDDTVVVWDNRAVQHYAASDYQAPRPMVRATMVGDVPVGVRA
jgi:taurine dioxygenase